MLDKWTGASGWGGRSSKEQARQESGAIRRRVAPDMALPLRAGGRMRLEEPREFVQAHLSPRTPGLEAERPALIRGSAPAGVTPKGRTRKARRARRLGP